MWCRRFTQPTTSLTTGTGMSCGRTARAPRRATVSAIRRPATAVMFATTSGMVVPLPSVVDRSTSKRERDVGASRDHEDVVVGQFVGRRRSDEVHEVQSLPTLSPVLAVFDIDGVVADVRHRLRHLERGSWRRFFDAAARRPAAGRGRAAGRRPRRLARDRLADRAPGVAALDHRGLVARARPARRRSCTCAPPGDYRPAPRYKLDVLETLRPRGVAAVIDDDDEVVRAALRRGFPAVLADWVPRTDVLRRAQDRDGTNVTHVHRSRSGNDLTQTIHRTVTPCLNEMDEPPGASLDNAKLSSTLDCVPTESDYRTRHERDASRAPAGTPASTYRRAPPPTPPTATPRTCSPRTRSRAGACSATVSWSSRTSVSCCPNGQCTGARRAELLLASPHRRAG